MTQPLKLLFICSLNRWRSLTAETMYEGFPGYVVKSAGTEPGARIKVNEGHVGWADIIFAMEKKHVRILREKFGEALRDKKIVCLHIPDSYRYMDPALIDELKTSLSQYVEVPE